MWNKLKQLKNVPVIRGLYRLWMLFAKALGFVMSRVIFTFLYVVVVGAYALAARAIRVLRRTELPLTYWKEKPDETQTLESLKNQF